MLHHWAVQECYKTENTLLLLIDKSRYIQYLHNIDLYQFHNDFKESFLFVCDL